MSETIKIQFRSADDTTHDVEATIGKSVMEAAVMANVPGIEAECGGCCSCATCHVFSLTQWGEPDEDEDAMLDETASPRRDQSRLSCQIIVRAEMDGAVFVLPEQQ
jgi:2Fe-2S ferredoxin